jgi:hypothetical protein
MINSMASMLTQQSVLPKFLVWNVLNPSAPLQSRSILALFLGSGTSRPASSPPTLKTGYPAVKIQHHENI